MFATVAAQLPGELGMSEQLSDLIRTSLYRVNEHASQLMNDLVGNSADRAGVVGLPFHRASVTVSPKPSLIDFCTTMVEARCRALISSAHQGGKSRMTMSEPSPAASFTSLRTRAFGIIAGPATGEALQMTVSPVAGPAIWGGVKEVKERYQKNRHHHSGLTAVIVRA